MVNLLLFQLNHHISVTSHWSPVRGGRLSPQSSTGRCQRGSSRTHSVIIIFADILAFTGLIYGGLLSLYSSYSKIKASSIKEVLQADCNLWKCLDKSRGLRPSSCLSWPIDQSQHGSTRKLNMVGGPREPWRSHTGKRGNGGACQRGPPFRCYCLRRKDLPKRNLCCQHSISP